MSTITPPSQASHTWSASSSATASRSYYNFHTQRESKDQMMRCTVALTASTIFIFGCATEPSFQWTHPRYDTSGFEVDNLTCEARGYEVAGPLPQYQPAPNCSGGFSCGYQKGAVQASNAQSRDTWNSAFNAGYRSCMYEKGYTLTPVG